MVGICSLTKTRANREIDIKEVVFRNNLWFSLKITFPHRDFEFDYSMSNRFNPELDHIFPRNLAGMDEEYKEKVSKIIDKKLEISKYCHLISNAKFRTLIRKLKKRNFMILCFSKKV